MTGVDACVVIWFLSGRLCPEAKLLAVLLSRDEVVLAPCVVTELLSDPKGGETTRGLVSGVELIDLREGYWARAGLLRAKVKRAGRKAALGDALAAQACLDADLPFLTGDSDFKAFAEIAGLRLAM